MVQFLRIVVSTLVLSAAIVIVPAEGFLDLYVKDGLLSRSQVPLYLVRSGALKVPGHATVGPSPRNAAVEHRSSEFRPEAVPVRFEWNTTRQHLRYTMDLASGDLDAGLKISPSIPLSGVVPMKKREFTLQLSCLKRSQTSGRLSIKFDFRDASDNLVYKNSPTIRLTKRCSLPGESSGKKRHEFPHNAKAEQPSASVPKVGMLRTAGQRVWTKTASTKLRKEVYPLAIGMVDRLVPTKSSSPTTPAMPAQTGSTAEQREEEYSGRLENLRSPVCTMCQVPHSTTELRKIVCRSDYVIRARLDKYSSSSPTSSRHWITLNLRDLRPFVNWPLMTSRHQATAKMAATTAVRRAKLVLGKQSVACTCNGKINNKGMFLLVGKWGKRAPGRQLVVRHNRGMLLPWREARRLFRRARNLRC